MEGGTVSLESSGIAWSHATDAGDTSLFTPVYLVAIAGYVWCSSVQGVKRGEGEGFPAREDQEEARHLPGG